MDEQELDKLKEYWVDGNYLYDQESDAFTEAVKDTVVLIAALEAAQQELAEAQAELEIIHNNSKKWAEIYAQKYG